MIPTIILDDSRPISEFTFCNPMKCGNYILLLHPLNLKEKKQ